ncbi:hypothetical protein JQM83_15130, partial [Parabacteroides distasonis]|nr:hypothetical protein [Parabacteroides distasonis]
MRVVQDFPKKGIFATRNKVAGKMNGQKQREKPKRIPYGMMNFGRLRRDNCYFV